MAPERRPVVTVFGHAWCHLCAEMESALRPLVEPLGFVLELVDIEGREELEARFGEYVPVLFVGEEQVCHYHLDEAKLRLSLARHRRPGRADPDPGRRCECGCARDCGRASVDAAGAGADLGEAAAAHRERGDR